jgi:glutamate N-acetyltransferase/amino-acid N-acetyltransferase
VATGASGVSVDSSNVAFVESLQQVFTFLAQAIVRDGEGATKFVEILVEGAVTTEDARALAYTVAHSPLVKTALFASDANWGRILAAIGRAPLAKLDIDRLDLYLGSTRLLYQGMPDADYTEDQGQVEMARDEITIRVDLNSGDQDARVWTSDLSHGYVKINAEYRS